MYLIDSDVLIDFLKNKKEAVELIGKIDQDKIATSIICVGEILEGLVESKIENFLKMTETIKVYSVDEKEILKFAQVRKILRKNGNLIDNFDILIAATCLANDLVLVTNNLKHFKRIPELKILR